MILKIVHKSTRVFCTISEKKDKTKFIYFEIFYVHTELMNGIEKKRKEYLIYMIAAYILYIRNKSPIRLFRNQCQMNHKCKQFKHRYIVGFSAIQLVGRCHAVRSTK